MAHVIRNLVEQGSVSTGATGLDLTIAAVPPYRPFSGVLSDGDTTEAMVVNLALPTEWQAAVYRYATGRLTFVRLIDSSTGVQISFSAGTKRVYMTPVAERGEWVRRTGAFDVIAGDRCDVDTSDGPITATLPADLSEGDRFVFNDYAGTWGTNNLIIDGNGALFEDGGTRLICRDPACFSIVVGPAGVLLVR